MECLPDGQSLPLALVAYLAFTLLAVVLPALAVLRLLRLALEPAAVVPLGLSLCAAAYWVSLVAARAWLFPALLGALVVVGLGIGRRAGWRFAPGPSVRGAFAPFLALVALFAVTQFPLNRCSSDGGFALDSLERVDTAFHVAVTWELVHGWPPQVPGLAGVPLDYHFGPHLARAALARFAGVHPYDALARFDVTLWALALVLAMRSVTAAMGARPAVVALAPWTLVAGDLAWLLAGRARGAWLTELLGGNVMVALVFTNTLVPALALALATLVALDRARRGQGRGWLALAALLGAALPFFKVFVAAQLLGGLAVALVLARGRGATAVAAMPCAVALLAQGTGHGARTVSVLLDPLGVAQALRAALGLAPAHGTALALSAVAWLALGLGLRGAGLPAALRALRSDSAPVVALAAMALAGWPVRLLGRLTVDGRFDETVYFTVQSGVLLWLFALVSLVDWSRRVRARFGPRGVALLAAGAAALALPTSIEFVARKAATPPEPVPAEVIRTTARLAALTVAGEVVLTPSFSRYPPPPVVFIGRRIPYTEYLPYLSQFAPRDVLAERLREVRRFFKNVDGEQAALATAARSKARFVALFGHRAPVEDARWLTRVDHEGDAGGRIYRVRTEAGAPALSAAPAEAR